MTDLLIMMKCFWILIFSTAKGDQLFLKVTGNSQRKVDEDLADVRGTGRIIEEQAP